MATQDTPLNWRGALPFWLSFALVPLVWVGAVKGGLWLLLTPAATWYLFSMLDGLLGLDTKNPDPLRADHDLRLYTLLTSAWVPVQAINLFALIAYIAPAEHLTAFEKFGVFFGMGILSGTIGITYSHELMHQKGKLERWLGDLLLAMVLYSHFRSEHLLVHHIHVGTPKDPVTARYNEGFHRFYPRVLAQSLRSSFRAEKAMLARKKLPWHDRRNPFFRYWGLQLTALLIAYIIGGGVGVVLFITQAGIAIWQLELVNYVEHYGLTRRYKGNGKYEHVQPRHSWNSAHMASNWLLINLQRHSDHHYKPDRRFPLLQNYSEDDAPQLPYGYAVMTVAAMIPPLWRRIMNPKVRAWRQKYYPDITDWSAYNAGRQPEEVR
ncbi:alkane 1-monooxygenase [Epibacterium ulvae]|uniref:Alkane 1-monooxygenase n=1 Tax=Epibacterium ulvae TaxID=1156985 RepID=A0A1G5RAE4_9RHOB|nr:alkane 1-monooxygenase [Epibacterium ulvae]SCZ70279.1 alkane 1-monooxygenase [Epibacterium ulvae]